MTGYRFISVSEIVATYMFGFGTNKVAYEELRSWAQHLEKRLSTKNYKTIARCMEKHIAELQREDRGFLFNVGDHSIKLAEGKTKKDLDEHVLSYADTDVLEAMVYAPKEYKKNVEITV